MIDEHSLYPTEEEALAAPGELYRHFKGGIYRIVMRGVKDSETLEDGVIYEHLWPHEHRFWYRLESSFNEPRPDGGVRFERIKSEE